jgi:hypothetical protein
VPSIVTLVRDHRLSSGAMCIEYIQWVSCIQLTTSPVYFLTGAQHTTVDTISFLVVQILPSLFCDLPPLNRSTLYVRVGPKRRGVCHVCVTPIGLSA